MPTISRFYGMLIIMYYREGFNEYDAKISINNYSILKGNLPTHAFALIKEWTALHQSELFDNWERIKRGEILKKIEPLI